MQKTRFFVAVVSLFVMLGLADGAFAARRNDNQRLPDAQGQSTHQQQQQQQKEQEKNSKPKSWIVKILDDLESKYSLPPG